MPYLHIQVVNKHQNEAFHDKLQDLNRYYEIWKYILKETEAVDENKLKEFLVFNPFEIYYSYLGYNLSELDSNNLFKLDNLNNFVVRVNLKRNQVCKDKIEYQRVIQKNVFFELRIENQVNKYFISRKTMLQPVVRRLAENYKQKKQKEQKNMQDQSV